MATMGPVSIRTRSATPEPLHVLRVGAEVRRQPPCRPDQAELLGEVAAIGTGRAGPQVPLQRLADDVRRPDALLTGLGLQLPLEARLDPDVDSFHGSLLLSPPS